MDFVSVRAKVLSDGTGAVSEIPVLLTSDGPLLPLVDYLLWRRHDRSVSWMRKVVHDVALLLMYMKVNSDRFHDPEGLCCSRRLKFDPPCRSNFDPGLDVAFLSSNCG